MTRLATALFASIVILTGVGLWLSVGSSEGMIAGIAVGIWLLALGGIGALVASRRPENPIGWLMLAIAILVTLHGLAGEYASYVLERGHLLPGGEVAAWLSLWLLAPGFALFIPLLLLFPSGKLPSPRWVWVLRLAVFGIFAAAVGLAIRPGPVDYIPKLDNPFAVDAGGLEVALADGGESLLTLLGLVAAASLVIRFRRASGTEREQIKWFVYAIAMIPILALISIPVDAVDGEGASYGAFAVNMTAALLIPLSLGVAILRNRLYDIDVIVNRTLVYGVLTALLAGAYLGIVVLLQGVLAPVTSDSDLAIAASTLAVAALFRPLRARVQAFIDRRFYRRKYDAAETLDRFSGRLRDEVELDALSHSLIAVVGDTMQPSHASLWLRSQGAQR